MIIITCSSTYHYLQCTLPWTTPHTHVVECDDIFYHSYSFRACYIIKRRARFCIKHVGNTLVGHFLQHPVEVTFWPGCEERRNLVFQLVICGSRSHRWWWRWREGGGGDGEEGCGGCLIQLHGWIFVVFFVECYSSVSRSLFWFRIKLWCQLARENKARMQLKRTR